MHKRFRIRTIQAEDEIAAVTAAIGASFGGAIGVTGSSGPGIALKGEGIGLAGTAEVPPVVFNIQPARASTRMPRKTEEADPMRERRRRHNAIPLGGAAHGDPARCLLH